ncbi:S-layer homology domain-containing protein, partial [Patescibacteria group bacterium]|nr:S-layer homology domain-containing protein [Patescibacteria group bacterium]
MNILKKWWLCLFFFLVSLSGGFYVHASSFFSDLPSDSLYSPYIENLQEKHFIIGDTAFGVPLDTFRPDDSITRSEFTKITVLIYLAELFGDSENWDNMS